MGPATESARQPPAAYFLPTAAKVCKKRRLNLRFKNPLVRPVPCRSLRCVPYGWKFYARGIKCSIVSAPAPLPLTVQQVETILNLGTVLPKILLFGR